MDSAESQNSSERRGRSGGGRARQAQPSVEETGFKMDKMTIKDSSVYFNIKHCMESAESVNIK